MQARPQGLRIALALVVGFASTSAGCSPCGEDSPLTIPQRAAESSRTNVRLELRTAPAWDRPQPGQPRSVDIRIVVSNHGTQAVRLRLDGLRFTLVAEPSGSAVPIQGGRDLLLAGGPYTPRIEPGAALVLDRSSTLEVSSTHGPLRLFGPDGLGGTWAFENLRPGRYRLGLTYKGPVPGQRSDATEVVDSLAAPAVDVMLH